MQFIEKLRKHKIAVGVVIALLVSGLIFWIWSNRINNEALQQQRDLITADNNVAIVLSTCLDNSGQSAKIVLQQYKSLKDLFVATAQARYQDESSANAAIQGGSMFSGIREDYPKIDQTTWNTLLGIVVGCRKEVADEQKNLQFWAGEFDKWRQTGGIFEKGIRNNYPNELLYTKGPDGKEIHGMEALKHLMTPITIKDAKIAMENREMPEQDLFGGNQPTSAPTPVPTATPTR